MKTIATIAATLLLSLGVLITPASAEEPVEADCASMTYDGTDLEMALTNEVKGLRLNLTVVESTLTTMRAQRDLEANRGDKLQAKVENKQSTIDRLRAELRKR